MKIDQPLKQLGDIDAAPLRDAILGQEEAAWSEQEYRQQEYEVHRRTTSIVLVFTDGRNWPQITVRKEPGWDRLAHVALPAMQHVIANHYRPGGTIIRAMAARLAAGGRIDPHRDSHASFHASHRIHIPVTTNPRVRFMIDGRPHRLEVGKVYELNNQLLHSVMNKGDEDRITFIFDYLPPDAARAAS
ncbi:MAG TPA: aspartyl/asparaginyl beta-hydroxylase domain-containing protein [Woeseiaceae bacterium]|nr:aspartyl/asparaginyl beta-hydroxylase domain-containing protein [Woeseiaceae bacterium]